MLIVCRVLLSLPWCDASAEAALFLTRFTALQQLSTAHASSAPVIFDSL